MLHAAVIALSSLLLFLVQPLIARLILPWFGGGAAVWTTCMLFFQTLLLAGYAYAHASNARLAPRPQAILHIALLAAAAATLPIAPTEAWKPQGDAEPITAILLLLAVAVGLPYFILSATSPLVQAWFARERPGANPYRLFALSNVASLAALIGYPLLVEPWLTNGEQVSGWSWLFVLFALGCAALAWQAGGLRGRAAAALPEAPPPARRDIVHWLALSAAGSAMLLAVTNHLTQNVAAIPLLWLAPLTLYLVTFILAFEGGFYRSEIFWSVCLVWLVGMAWLLVDHDYQFELPVQLGMFLSGLFVTCLFCHGELYRLRPAPRHLTVFYLTVSAGGALGGLAVAVVAPLAFNGYYELGLSMIAVAFLAALRCATLNPVARNMSLAVLMTVTGAAIYDGLRFQEGVRVAERNFYGVLRVKEYGTPGETSHARRLLHGVIMHGEQFMHPEYRGMVTTYYQHSSGVGAALLARRERPGAMHVGVIGLGTGTLAAYGRKGDRFRFYEINPRVVGLAAREFAYLADSDATLEMVLGDARLSLEREPPQNFDILAVDAFSSDAIPVHLITREALALYLRHMKPDGIVAFHVSNRFLDLVPVVARLAAENGAHAVLVAESAGDDDTRTQSDWVLVSRDARALKAKEIEEAGAEVAEDRAALRTWTDDYSNLVQILK
ncbi:MAG TPA: fused MFS/spermidine synthase [Burkholderiales bacterium]